MKLAFLVSLAHTLPAPILLGIVVLAIIGAVTLLEL